MNRYLNIIMTIFISVALITLSVLSLDKEILPSNFILITSLIAVFHGISMKIADLLDEHGMKSFKGSTIYYGILWGGFASLWVIVDTHLANAILATILAFLIRMRLDYRNHAIAASMVIITFISVSSIIPNEFILLFSGFTLLGLIKDYLGERKITNKILYYINEFASYSIITSLVYSIIFGNWIVFIAVALSTISYGLVKFYFHKWGYYKVV